MLFKKHRRLGPWGRFVSPESGDAKKKKGNRAMGKAKYPKAIKYYTKAMSLERQVT